MFRTSPRLRLAVFAIASLLILPAVLGADGAMTNGQNHTGTIAVAGEVDVWTFTATAGDAIVLAIGEVGGNSAFVPWIRLTRPDAVLVGNQSGVLAAQIEVVAALTGTYTVQVASFDTGFDDTGDYTLTVAKTGSAFTVSPGDEGGPMTNGANHTGLLHVGDLDVWTFDATVGDSIMLGIGEVGPDTAFVPWIRLKSPTGQNLGSQSGNLAAQIDVTANVTGTYTVIVSTFDTGLDATGSYTLTLAKTGTPFSISGGDEGGALTNGSNHTGLIHVGDLDMWSFDATAGEAIVLALGEVGADSAFVPWLRLKSPTGQNLGSQSGNLATQFEATATVTGTYTVVVSTLDAGLDATGSYTLTLAKTGSAFTTSGGDQGGAMTNGSNHTGQIHVGDLDMWSFSATAGEAIVLALGEVGADSPFVPWLRLKSPTGQNLGSLSATLATQFEATATVTGTYTVVVSTFDAGLDATGNYTLTLAKTGTPFTISGGDQGGALTNGGNHTGAIHVGDLDMWSFTAVAGEALVVAIGEVGPDSAFAPWIRLKSPTGQNLGSASGVLADQIATTATVTGTYTVIVSTFDAGLDATGNYTLTIANTPRPFIVPLGDHGGAMAGGPGAEQAGTIHIGDLDMWTFIAHSGDPLSVTIDEIGSPVDFTPWIRLFSPTGALVGSVAGATTAQINANAPATGVYTVVVSTFDSGLDGSGDYEFTVTGTSTNMIKNGQFNQGETFWQFFATPTLAHIVHQVTNGVLEYYRVPPPPGTSNQAVAFQETGVSLPAFAPVVAQFDLANTSPARKRISVLVLNSNFDDLSVCTFWMEPSAPMRTYQMRTHTTQAWANAALYFYAASEGSAGNVYQVDNVSMAYDPEEDADRTDCVDPTKPTPPGGADGPNLIGNGDFGTGSLAPWFTFSDITWRIAGGVFEFVKPANTNPSGVVAQATGQAMTASQILTATFELGNSSNVRKRVTVILGDSDFSDISACTFWLGPNQPLSPYVYRTFTTKPWTNALLSVYPATVDALQWIRLDNVTLQRTPTAAIVGTECLEPGAESAAFGEAARQAPIADVNASQGGAASFAGISPGALASSIDSRNGAPFEIVGSVAGVRGIAIADPIDLRDAGAARMTFESWLTEGAGRASVQVSLDGFTWLTLQEVPLSTDWTPVEIDLSSFTGEVIYVRLVLDARTAFEAEEPAVWRFRNVRVHR